MDKIKQELIKTLEGTEIFFRDVGCVGIEGNTLTRGGEVILVIDSNKKANEVIEAYKMQEYGTTDMDSIMKMEGF